MMATERASTPCTSDNRSRNCAGALPGSASAIADIRSFLSRK
jgi:hypothetical protein